MKVESVVRGTQAKTWVRKPMTGETVIAEKMRGGKPVYAVMRERSGHFSQREVMPPLERALKSLASVSDKHKTDEGD